MRDSLRDVRLGLFALLLGLASTLGLPVPGFAQDGHEGHNHGGEEAATPIPVNPRGVTETASYQLAAVMVRGQLVVFLDNPDSNEPISDATIEMTANDHGLTLSPRGDGAYVAEGWRPRIGHNALMFFVDSAGTADLLNVALDVADAKETAAAAPAAATGGLGGKKALLIALPVALALGLLVSVAVTRATRKRRGDGTTDDAPAPALAEPLQT